MPWFGARNLCIYEEDYYMGGCNAHNKGGEDSSYRNYRGFPMVQQTVFNGRRFCGKVVRGKSGETVTPAEAYLKSDGCLDSETICGSPE